MKKIAEDVIFSLEFVGERIYSFVENTGYFNRFPVTELKLHTEVWSCRTMTDDHLNYPKNHCSITIQLTLSKIKPS